MQMRTAPMRPLGADPPPEGRFRRTMTPAVNACGGAAMGLAACDMWGTLIVGFFEANFWEEYFSFLRNKEGKADCMGVCWVLLWGGCVLLVPNALGCKCSIGCMQGARIGLTGASVW